MGVLESYNAFVLEYAEPVKTFESALRNASLVLHGRFKDSDLVAEAGTLVHATSVVGC